MREYSYQTFGNKLDDAKYRDELASRIATLIRVRGLTAKDVQRVIPTLSKSAISNLRAGYAESISIARLELLLTELPNLNPSPAVPKSLSKAA